MISSPDTGYARCHEEARAAITHAIPGADVRFFAPRRGGPRDMAYEIALTLRLGDAPTIRRGSYTLPAPARQLAADARTAVESAIKEDRP